MKILKHIILHLLVLTFALFFISCRKAKTDEEMREMIVGTWKAKIRGANIPGGVSTYKIIEFSIDNKYISVQFRGYKNTWMSADTSGLNFAPEDVNSHTDSVTFSIENGYLTIQGKEIYEKREIKKLTNKKLQLDEATYKKI